jgi:hypothetical protein
VEINITGGSHHTFKAKRGSMTTGCEQRVSKGPVSSGQVFSKDIKLVVLDWATKKVAVRHRTRDTAGAKSGVKNRLKRFHMFQKLEFWCKMALLFAKANIRCKRLCRLFSDLTPIARQKLDKSRAVTECFWLGTLTTLTMSTES